MLYTTPRWKDFSGHLRELDDLHDRLAGVVAQRPAWLYRFRRRAHAAAARSSAALEGYRVDPAPAVAIVEGRVAASGRAERVVAGCALAMQHVAVLADDPSFDWSVRLLLDLHFECCSTEFRAHPGRWRTDPVWMTAPEGGPAYQAPPASVVAGRMGELVEWLRHDDGAPPVVRGAMAHLHLFAIHPFADGNGRMARVLHSLVLARHRLTVTGLGAVEERFARDPGRYHAVLREVLGGSYQPGRDATPWVAFCLDAHVLQVREQLALLEGAAHRWSMLQGIIASRDLPARLAVALEQSLGDGIDRGSYAAETEVATATASTDLRRLMDAGLVVRVGRARHTRYLASDALRRMASAPNA